MKKQLLASITILTLSMASSMSVLAAPKIMPDGGVFDAEYYAENNPDVVQAYGTDKDALYSHYVNNGRAEGRQGFLITKDMYTTSTEDSYFYNNYLCEHGVVCKTEDSIDRLCVKCRAIEEAERAEYNRRHSGHVSDDKGYIIGSTFSGRDSRGNTITLTYRRNDVWSGSDGYSWYAYLDENDCIHWSSGIR